MGIDSREDFGLGAAGFSGDSGGFIEERLSQRAVVERRGIDAHIEPCAHHSRARSQSAHTGIRGGAYIKT